MHVGDFKLPSGRLVHLHELKQSLVYEGGSEGLPSALSDHLYLETLLTEFKRDAYNVKPYFTRTIEWPTDYEFDFTREHSAPSKLPRILCVGRFESIEPAQDIDCHYSGMTFIWFQNEYAFPIIPAMVEEITNVDWEKLAGDMAD